MYSRHIESFIETAKAGSFTKAARALYIAPSSLIQQIDLLEQRLGVVLFERGHRGVTLTEAGEGAVRVATSLLMKCRMLPGIWSHMIEEAPGTRIDIISLESAGVQPGSYLRGLGVSYDVMEGLFMSELYQDRCLFLDLDLVMMKQGVSADYDAAHRYLADLGANRVTEVPFYTMELFADCELNQRAIVTFEMWEDIHPNLVCIPFSEPYSMPYGLIFPKRPSGPAMKLYQTAKEMLASEKA